MGPTHQGMEDMGVMRMMPNMTVIAPGDPLQLSQFIDQAYEIPGPVYIRLGRGDDPVIYPDGQELKVGKAITTRDGRDITVVACGTMMNDAIRASDELRTQGISARVLDMHTVKPLDVEAVICAAEETGHLVTVEDHTIIGGLGSAVAEAIADAGVTAKLKRLGVPDVFALVGPPAELYEHYGFDRAGIVRAARALLGAK